MANPIRVRWYERNRIHTVVKGESRTQQAHKDSSDVNHIVQRYQRTGELPKNPRGQEPIYEDVTHLQQDLTEAYNDANERAERATAELNEQKAKAAEERKEQAYQERKQREADEARQNAPPPLSTD